MLFCSYLHEQFSASICKSPGNQLSVWKKNFAEIVFKWKGSPYVKIGLCFRCVVFIVWQSFSALNIDRLLETLGIENSLHRTATCITSPLGYWVVYWRFHISDQLITLDIHLVSAFYRCQCNHKVISPVDCSRWDFSYVSDVKKYRWYTSGNNDKDLGKV